MVTKRVSPKKPGRKAMASELTDSAVMRVLESRESGPFGWWQPRPISWLNGAGLQQATKSRIGWPRKPRWTRDCSSNKSPDRSATCCVVPGLRGLSLEPIDRWA
jgi:hypothetical protein